MGHEDDREGYCHFSATISISFGLLLIKPSGWRPLNRWTNPCAAILIPSASLGLLENKAMQILGSKVKGCPDWCIWIRSASLDQGRGNEDLSIFLTQMS